eukprot:4786522-Pyramimonas_sp.AAC.1
MSQEKRFSFRVKCFAREDVSKETLGTQCMSQVQRVARKEVSGETLGVDDSCRPVLLRCVT